jgi:hypothetical protein
LLARQLKLAQGAAFGFGGGFRFIRQISLHGAVMHPKCLRRCTLGEGLAGIGLALRRFPIGPDVGTATAAGGADKGGLDVGQPDVIRPSIRIEARRVAATIVGAIDQHAVHVSAKVIFWTGSDMASIPPTGLAWERLFWRGQMI